MNGPRSNNFIKKKKKKNGQYQYGHVQRLSVIDLYTLKKEAKRAINAALLTEHGYLHLGILYLCT